MIGTWLSLHGNVRLREVAIGDAHTEELDGVNVAYCTISMHIWMCCVTIVAMATSKERASDSTTNKGRAIHS